MLPYAGGIHSIGNLSEETAISVHLYGPRMSDIDGRDYDPSRAYVCDRPADTVTEALQGATARRATEEERPEHKLSEAA